MVWGEADGMGRGVAEKNGQHQVSDLRPGNNEDGQLGVGFRSHLLRWVVVVVKGAGVGGGG